jgi:hypothetical protein
VQQNRAIAAENQQLQLAIAQLQWVLSGQLGCNRSQGAQGELALQEQLQQQEYPALQVHQQQDDFTPALPCNMPSAAQLAAAPGASAASAAPDAAAAGVAGPSAAAEDLLFESLIEVGLPGEGQPACDDYSDLLKLLGDD